MNDTERKQRIAASAAVEIQEIIDTLRAVGDGIEEATGHRVVAPPPRSVVDATRSDLLALRDQVRAADRALTLCLGWVGPSDTLGRVLKVMPQQAQAEITAALRAARMLSGEE